MVCATASSASGHAPRAFPEPIAAPTHGKERRVGASVRSSVCPIAASVDAPRGAGQTAARAPIRQSDGAGSGRSLLVNSPGRVDLVGKGHHPVVGQDLLQRLPNDPCRSPAEGPTSGPISSRWAVIALSRDRQGSGRVARATGEARRALSTVFGGDDRRLHKIDRIGLTIGRDDFGLSPSRLGSAAVRPVS